MFPIGKRKVENKKIIEKNSTIASLTCASCDYRDRPHRAGRKKAFRMLAQADLSELTGTPEDSVM